MNTKKISFIAVILFIVGIPLLYVACPGTGGDDPNTGGDDPSTGSSTAPAWSTEPTVVAEAGGYTITAGTVTGDPEPVVSYYVAPDKTSVPADEASESAWTNEGFSVVQAGPNATVASDGTKGGVAGDLDLYAVAVNSAGHKKTGSIDFSVTAAAVAPGFGGNNYPDVSTPDAGAFTLAGSLGGDVTGDPYPAIEFYYTLRSNEDTAPDDAPWPGNDWPETWTRIDVNDGGKISDTSKWQTGPFDAPAGEYSLYSVLTNYAGSTKWGSGTDGKDPIRITVK